MKVTKRIFHTRKPSNVISLKQSREEVWAKIPPQRWQRLIASYHERLIAVVAANQLLGLECNYFLREGQGGLDSFFS